MSFEVFWKHAKWIGLFVLALLGWVAWAWFRPTRKEIKDGDPAIPPAPNALLQAVEQAHEDALKARVKASVESDIHEAQLTEISKIDNGVERRKRLAAMLKKQ